MTPTPATAAFQFLPPTGRTVERWTALTLIAVIGTFELALAAGAPWGVAAWGGHVEGVLPTTLRVASAVAVLVYGALGMVVATDLLSSTARRRLLTGASVLIALGAVANIASPSPVEMLWAPVAATLALTLWRLREAR